MEFSEVLLRALPPRIRADRDANLSVKYLVQGSLTVNQTELIVETAPEPYLHQLPGDLPPDLLAHREAEVRACRDALVAAEGPERGDEDGGGDGGGDGPRRPPVVVLHGGLGSDADDVAVHLGHELQDRFPDFQLCLDVGGLPPATPGAEPEDLLATLIRSFGIATRSIPDRLDERAVMFRSLVAGRRGLLVLQNVTDAGTLRRLLPGSSTCAVVVTSDRELPGLEGARQVRLGRMSDEQARNMLAYLIGQDRVSGDPDGMAAVLDWTDRRPLWVRYAADLLRGHGIRDLPLERAAAVLTKGDRRGGPDGDQFTAGLQAAYDRVPEEARRVFRYLGALQVRDLEVGPVAAMARLDPRQARRRLDELVEAGLVERPDQAPGRYRLHGPARRFAQAWSGQAQRDGFRDRRAALERAFTWYAERLDLTGLDEPAQILGRMDWFDRERPNLIGALVQACEEKLYRVALRLSVRMGRLLDARHHWATWRQTATLGLRAALGLDNPAAERVARQNLGDAFLRNADYAEAIDQYEASLALRTEADGEVGKATVLARLAEAHAGARDYDQAVAAYEASLGVHRAMRGDRPPDGAEAWLLQQLGTADRERGALDQAIGRYHESLDVYRRLDDRPGQADARLQLAVALHRHGRPAEALQELSRADELCAELGADGLRAEALRLAGAVHRELDQLDEAITAFKRARVLCRAGHDRRAEAATLRSLAEACRDRGAFDEAARTFQAAARLAGAVNDRPAEARLLRELGETYLAGDRPEEATPALERSLRLYRVIDDGQSRQAVEDLLRQASAAPRRPPPEPPDPAPRTPPEGPEGPSPARPPGPTPPSRPPSGLARIRDGIGDAREARAAPVTAVGFGRR